MAFATVFSKHPNTAKAGKLGLCTANFYFYSNFSAFLDMDYLYRVLFFTLHTVFTCIYIVLIYSACPIGW